jgi:hypothetical protein
VDLHGDPFKEVRERHDPTWRLFEAMDPLREFRETQERLRSLLEPSDISRIARMCEDSAIHKAARMFEDSAVNKAARSLTERAGFATEVARGFLLSNPVKDALDGCFSTQGRDALASMTAIAALPSPTPLADSVAFAEPLRPLDVPPPHTDRSAAPSVSVVPRVPGQRELRKELNTLWGALEEEVLEREEAVKVLEGKIERVQALVEEKLAALDADWFASQFAPPHPEDQEEEE